MPRVLSGLQKEVLALYRKVLREAHHKDCQALSTTKEQQRPSLAYLLGRKRRQNDPSTTTRYAVEEFRRQAQSVKRSDFKRIEYLIRKGEKQVKLLQMPGVKHVLGSQNTSSLSTS